VKVNRLQVRLPALGDLSLRRSPAAIRRWNEAASAARAAAEETRLPSGEKVLVESAAPFAEDPEAPAPLGPCRLVGREAWVHPDGRFAPCPHPAAVAGYEEHPVCRGCPFRRPGGA